MPRSTSPAVATLSPRRRGPVALGLGILASLVLATRSAAPPVPAVIELKAFMFAPTALTVTVGTAVAWKNLDAEPHTVASIDGAFRSGALDQGESFTFTFAKPGTYRYVCSIHPQMTGTVIVTAPP